MRTERNPGLIAIHNGGGWNVKWIQYCHDRNIPHKVVNAYDSDILEQIRDCHIFMWHFHHSLPQDILMARNVLNAAEKMGLKVFPDHKTNWHFDDKLSQKYLFEALGLPAAPSWAFYDRESALEFVRTCQLPVVAKLRRGAGSHNVRLLKTRAEATKYVKRMFGRGYNPSMRLTTDIRRKVRTSAVYGLRGILQRLKNVPRYAKIVGLSNKYFSNEKGYVYFQHFMPGNKSDLRISVIGGKAWAFRRLVRKNDFRASGSGVVDYDISDLPLEVVRSSFDIAEEIQMQSMCLDWVQDQDGRYWLVEVSYGFVDALVQDAPGYWDRDLNWKRGSMSPAMCVIENMIRDIQVGGSNT